MKYLLLYALLLCTIASNAQQSNESSTRMPRFKIDLMAGYGLPTVSYITANTINNYPSAISTSTTGNLKSSNTVAFAGNLEASYFFAANRHLGIGTGINYFHSQGTTSLTGFRVEYKDIDVYNNVYRQIITVNNLSENLQQTTINIPLVVKYQGRISGKLTFTADAGILFNASNTIQYKTDASFDYEAIYKYAGGGSQVAAVYDDAIIPGSSDFQITRKSYANAVPYGIINNVFDTLKKQGYNVGLDKKNNKSGRISNNEASIGFMLRPSASFAMSKKITINLGIYYTYQTFKNNTASTYRISKVIGDYESPVNSAAQTNITTLGFNLGVSYLVR